MATACVEKQPTISLKLSTLEAHILAETLRGVLDMASVHNNPTWTSARKDIRRELELAIKKAEE